MEKRLFYTAVDIKKIGFLNSETDRQLCGISQKKLFPHR